MEIICQVISVIHYGQLLLPHLRHLRRLLPHHRHRHRHLLLPLLQYLQCPLLRHLLLLQQ